MGVKYSRRFFEATTVHTGRKIIRQTYNIKSEKRAAKRLRKFQEFT